MRGCGILLTDLFMAPKSELLEQVDSTCKGLIGLKDGLCHASLS